MRVAALWLDELGDATNALLVVEDMLAREAPQDSPALDVCPLLERILAAAPPHAELRESVPSTAMGSDSERPPHSRRDSLPPAGGPKRMLVRQRAAALLKERYIEQGREGDLVRIYYGAADGVTAVADLSLAEILAGLSDP